MAIAEPNGREPKLLDRLARAVAARSISPRIESAYIEWCRQFILFHGKRHPKDLCKVHVLRFLMHLADSAKVSSSALIQARSAIVFLYREVLDGSFPWLMGIDVPKRVRSDSPPPRDTTKHTERQDNQRTSSGRKSPPGESRAVQPYEEAMAGLLNQVHGAIRVRQYSFRTEKSYARWIRRMPIASGAGSSCFLRRGITTIR